MGLTIIDDVPLPWYITPDFDIDGWFDNPAADFAYDPWKGQP